MPGKKPGEALSRRTAVWLAFLYAVLLPPSAVTAQVQIKVLDDGTHLIYNESSAQRARRTAGHLLPPPSEIALLIDHHSRQQGLSPVLVQAVVQVESGYNTRALSSKGAVGLMQLMPDTARMLGVTDPYNPDENIRGGTAYLKRMLERYEGDLTLALAAYNAGPTAVDRYSDVPPYRETRRYVEKVYTLYRGPGGAPSLLVQDHARDMAKKREKEEVKTSVAKRGGSPVFLTRDETGRILITTSPNSP